MTLGCAGVAKDPHTADRLETPETFREFRIPSDVTLGWSGCETTSATLADATLPTSTLLWMFVSALPWPAKKEADTFPLEKRPVRVPTCVMLGWKGWLTTRATFDWATFPTSTLLRTFVSALPWPAKNAADTLPETTRPVSVPTCVTFVWADWS